MLGAAAGVAVPQLRGTRRQCVQQRIGDVSNRLWGSEVIDGDAVGGRNARPERVRGRRSGGPSGPTAANSRPIGAAAEKTAGDEGGELAVQMPEGVGVPRGLFNKQSKGCEGAVPRNVPIANEGWRGD